MPRFAVIGNLVKDVIAGAPARPGGAVFCQARVFSEIEYAIDARLVTRCESDDRELLLGPLEQFGLAISLCRCAGVPRTGWCKDRSAALVALLERGLDASEEERAREREGELAGLRPRA